MDDFNGEVSCAEVVGGGAGGGGLSPGEQAFGSRLFRPP